MLTPQDIEAREFLVSLRGYDRDEVHAFLSQVAAEVAQLRARVFELESAPGAAPTAAAASAAGDSSAMFAEIARETQRILEAAQEAGNELKRKAAEDASREVREARAEATKVIAEGSRRRDEIEQVVHRLEASRTDLAEQLRGIGRTIEGVLRELGTEAPASSVRDAIASEALSESTTTAPAAQPQAEPVATAPDTDPADQSTAGHEGEAVLPADDGEQGAAAEPHGGTAQDGPAEPPAGTASDGSAAAPAESAQDGAEAEAVTGEDEGAPQSQDREAAAAAEPAVAAAGGSPHGGRAQPTPELFTSGLSESRTGSPTGSPEEPAAEHVVIEADGATTLGASLRSDALGPLHPKLARGLKRGLQDVQNVTLDRVRRSGAADPDQVLPAAEDVDGLVSATAAHLDAAYAAGVEAAGMLAEQDIDSPAERPDLAADLRAALSAKLEHSLGAALRMGAGDDSAALTERLSSAFGELRVDAVEELASGQLARAYELGMRDAWRQAGLPGRRWVLGPEPRCPEGRCRQNDQAGMVGFDQPFPSGDATPPVHPGCTCTTLPEPAAQSVTQA